MAKVVPTVLATAADEYADMLARARSLSKRVHVDISDGSLADGQTLGLAQVHVDTDTVLDLHLMLRQPAQQIDTALSLKPHLIILHAEAEGDVGGLIEQMRSLGVKAGVALLPGTSVESASNLILAADHVLIFTGTLGHNGGQFHTEQLKQVEQIRQLKPEIEISVDGGVNDSNAALISLQGVDVLYVGGFLQGASDPAQALEAINSQLGIAV